ncbi:MAG: inositol monophosphatase family protein [Burkholderiaceae bacterium]
MHPMLNTAVKAARRAATIINRASFDLDQVRVSQKGPNDFVSEVDQAAEQAIIDVLKQAYPDHGFIAEESGISAAAASNAEHVWIIDPLDGTTNFIHGFPQYAVSIGLRQRGQITQAVVFDPNRNELFTATKGDGAYMNNKRIRVAKREKLVDALIGTGFPYRDLSGLDEYLKMFKLFTEKSAGLRRPGSAALDLAYVAAGRLDGFFEKKLKPWDMAAGALLVSEAGGIITGFSGEADHLDTGDVIAASPKIFAQMLATLSPFA